MNILVGIIIKEAALNVLARQYKQKPTVSSPKSVLHI